MAAFELYSFEPTIRFVGSCVPDGGAEVQKNSVLSKSFLLGSVDGETPILGQSLMDYLKSCGLVGPRFVLAQGLDHRDRKMKLPNPVFRMSSEFVLPPLSVPPCHFVDGWGKPWVEESKGRLLQDGDFTVPELYFDQNAMRQVGEFDLGRTAECFGAISEENPHLIYSKRLRQMLIDHGVEGRWYPVHLI